MKCNICGHNAFANMNNRINVRCVNCGSLERTRLLWLYLSRLRISKDTKVLHFAPEKGLYEALKRILDPDNYTVADIQPDRYRFAPDCKRIDLCQLEDQPSSAFDLILHSHVLEHTPCNIAYTLYHLHRMLTESGRHVCVIPFTAGHYDESFAELSDEERKRRFGQFDHVRRFGRDDLGAHLGKLVKLPAAFNAATDFTTFELREANIPESQWKGFHGSTILAFTKRDFLLGHI